MHVADGISWLEQDLLQSPKWPARETEGTARIHLLAERRTAASPTFAQSSDHSLPLGKPNQANGSATRQSAAIGKNAPPA